MSRLTRPEAHAILTACDIEPGADFHALNNAQIDALLLAANKRKYRKPTGANASRARYFHTYLQRAAQ